MKIVRLDRLLERVDFEMLVIELFEDPRIQMDLACDSGGVLIKYRHFNGELVTYHLCRELRQDEFKPTETLQ